MPSINTNNTKQASWVAIGSLFSFLVGIVTPMILSRFFCKNDYGTYKQVMFVYNTLLVVFSLGLPKAYAYFLPRVSSEYAKDIINKITLLFVLLGFLFFLLLFFFANAISIALNNDNLCVAIKYFSIYPLFILPTLGLDGIFATYRKTKLLALYTFVTRLFTVCLSVLPVIIFNGTYIHAIIGMDIAGFISFVFALYLRNLPIKHENKERSELRYAEVIRFALPLFYASLWGIIIKSSSQFFISRYYGSEEFADFSNGFMDIPILGMITASISTVLLPSFSRLDINTETRNESIVLWKSAVSKSARIIFPMLLFSVFCSSLIMTCMYGNEYLGSSKYFIIKNLGALFYIIPFSPIILAIGETKRYARAHMINAFILVTLQGLAVSLRQPPVVLAILFVVCDIGLIVNLSHIVAEYFSLKIGMLFSAKDLLKLLALSLFSGLISTLPAFFITLNKFILLSICFLSFVFVYYIFCRFCGVSYRDIISSLIKSSKYKRYINLIP